MAKKTEAIEVVKPEIVDTRKSYILLKNVGSKKDGSPKHSAGSKIKLTDEQKTIYEQQKLI